MSAHTDPNVTTEIDRALKAWRTRALDILLVVLLIVSLPAMISSVVNTIRGPELASRVWVYPLVFLIALGLTVLRDIDVRWRGWGLMLLGYTNAIVSLTQLGMAGSGRLYLIWVPITAVILIGARAGYLTAAISLLIYVIFGVFASQGILAGWLDVVENPVTTSFWIEAGTALAMLLVPAVVLLERFYQLGISTLAAERLASAELAQANARLEEYSRTLAQKVEQRTAELAQATAEAEEARAAAEAATRAKSDFLAKMSHELRTPLNAILGFAQLMAGNANLTADQQENLTTINRSGEYLLALINDVLDMSKIEAGRITLHETSFDLHRLLDDLENMFQLRAADKELTLIFDRGPNVPRYVRADEDKLRQVLVNLLGNAVKFTHEGGVALRVACASTGSDTGQAPDGGRCRLRFEVEDTGPGIAAEDLDAVFDPFVQTASGQASREGTGLGLPISRQFVHLMGGEISASSEWGRGSVFSFEIPVETTAAADVQPAEPQRRAVGLAPNQPAYRILVVEDNWANRRLLVKLLDPLGFQVREAVNGQEAVEIAKRWQPHLIWMDLRMPVMDGYEATQRIKAASEGRAPVIVALTASAFQEDRETVLSRGCDEFVRKPFRREEILDVLSKHLGVRFVYEDEAQPSDIPTTDAEAVLTPAALAALPAQWLEDLRKATVRARLDEMLRLIDQIHGKNPALADALAALAKRFEYKTILTSIQQAIPEHAPTPS